MRPLRVNGSGEITMEPALLERWTVNGKHPRSAMRVTVREAYLHCAKALMRSKLWGEDYRVNRTDLPTYAQMLKDQGVTTQSVEELQAAIDESYATRLY
jgi:predicted pyridoxine 5'-phosphate oxidase superfamily flavin-nucleotide-binding protein